MRHAESAEKQVGQSDKERELTQRGVREALLIGAHLFKEQITFDCVYSSSAARAQATAGIVADAMKWEAEDIMIESALYDASTRTFFEFVTLIDSTRHRVLCVGHNPVISYLAESLTQEEIGDMPPGGFVSIRFPVDNWKDITPGCGQLESYITPRELMS